MLVETFDVQDSDSVNLIVDKVDKKRKNTFDSDFDSDEENDKNFENSTINKTTFYGNLRIVNELSSSTPKKTSKPPINITPSKRAKFSKPTVPSPLKIDINRGVKHSIKKTKRGSKNNFQTNKCSEKVSKSNILSDTVANSEASNTSKVEKNKMSETQLNSGNLEPESISKRSGRKINKPKRFDD